LSEHTHGGSGAPKARRRPLRLGCLVLLGLFAVWIAYRVEIPPRVFASTARRSDTVVLWEGLPHPRFERAVFNSELANTSNHELGGFRFYDEPLEVAPEDVAQLRELLGQPSTHESYWPFFSWTLCGGFHPDYAVEWHHGDSTDYALLCFSCAEVDLRGSVISSHHELSSSSYAALKSILSRYRKNRPQRPQPR